jgi:hypothetical protein
MHSMHSLMMDAPLTGSFRMRFRDFIVVDEMRDALSAFSSSFGRFGREAARVRKPRFERIA